MFCLPSLQADALSPSIKVNIIDCIATQLTKFRIVLWHGTVLMPTRLVRAGLSRSAETLIMNWLREVPGWYQNVVYQPQTNTSSQSPMKLVQNPKSMNSFIRT